MERVGESIYFLKIKRLEAKWSGGELEKEKEMRGAERMDHSELVGFVRRGESEN